ncbi:family 43 glycosylhydrolase [Glycomyces sp. NPDC047369]
MTDVIRNPILPGFHPDPSVVRVGEDYFVATSTFEWAPGVRLHRSKDLRHWQDLGGALGPDLLDLAGVPDSGGVWAPDLTYAHGRFHLLYSVVDTYAYGYKDCANYLVTAERIESPWSEPIRLPGRGFDAALFHDDDGSTWLLNMITGFQGVEIQRLVDGKAVGDPVLLLEGSPAGLTEGPHLYKTDGWYVLLCAEGGTGFNHGAIAARSRDLLGPYEIDPNGPLITARDKPHSPLQKAGHGCLVQTPAGEWYMTYLASRPYPEAEEAVPDDPRARDATGRCVLGRETAIAPVRWVDGWPRIDGAAPALEVPAPALPARPWPATDPRDDFDGSALDPRWHTLRRHADPSWLGLAERPSHLRITGGQSPFGKRTPSLVAQPLTHRRGVFEAGIEFTPRSVHQAAGICAYYNAYNWHFLQVALEDGEPWLSLDSSDRGRRERVLIAPAPARLDLRIEFDGPVVRFGYRTDAWTGTGLERDATVLSDEHATWSADGLLHAFGFTGAFAGLWVQDRAAEGGFADVDYASYRTPGHGADA